MVHWRLSPKAKLKDHLLLIVGMSVLYRCLPLGFVRRRIARSIPWIGALEKAALVGDVRGGDSFSDIYGLERFVVASLPIWSVILVRGSIVHFPQTYGPFRTRTSRVIARFLLRRSSAIIARDRESQRIAQDLAGDCIKVQLSPDVAFALYAEPPARIETDPPLATALAAGTIGVNVNGLMYNGGYNRGNMFGLKLDYASFLFELMVGLLATHPGEVLLVPHTYAPVGDVESDNEACAKLRASLAPALQSRVRIVTGEYDCHGIKGVISQCDFFVGARMHSCIAALSQGVPCVGIAYSMKFKGVFESVGADQWVVDGRSVSNQEAVARVLELYGQREAKREELRQSVTTAKQRLHQIFGALLSAPKDH